MSEQEFLGKNVLITGANSGIGYAQAKGFLKHGANVFAIDIKDDNLLNLQKNYGEFLQYQIADVADKQAVEQAVKQFGAIDILLNTAGILDGYAKTLDTSEALWDQIINTNLKGTYLVTNAVLPQMLALKKGCIINMTSIAGLVAGGGGAAYTASKHGIIGYTKQLDYDYIRDGIRANAIAPGAIETPMNAADFAGDGKMAKWVADETPAGRWAKPEEVADLTLFIASDKADYIHGAVIPIDGGWIMK
ncbi:MAG TPA: 3-oxoacyl-ACP reductase [Bacilli bacterium]|nr:3-oxoacyl-ACP reductase [Bacilli bacterium]